MVTIRVRSIMWFVAGLVLAVTALWTTSRWRAEALPGPAESTVVNVGPDRVLDSRDPTDLGLAGPFASQASQKLQITGSIPTATGTKIVVPAGATGVLLNVTGFNPSADGFISIRPGDATGAPTTSSLNLTSGQTVPNAVQVALPTSGPNAGQIDITFDALGQTGPTIDILIDVVGYTTSAGLQDVNTQLAQKANSADVYNKTDADGRFVPQGEIVLRYGHAFQPNATITPMTSLETYAYRVSSRGAIDLDLPGPAKLGATDYGLKSVSYCLSAVTEPLYVNFAGVIAIGPTDTSNLLDPADRTQVGCYTIEINDETASTYHLMMQMEGAGGEISVRNVTAVWAPVSSLP